MKDDSDMLRTVAREQKGKFQLRTEENSYKKRGITHPKSLEEPLILAC